MLVAESSFFNEITLIADDPFSETVSVDQEQIELNSTLASSEFNTTSLAEAHIDRKDYFRMYKQRPCKVSNLENIISNLASPQKRKVVHKVSQKFE